MIPDTSSNKLVKPTALNDNLNNIVEMINPVFLISWEYLSVYWNEIKSINTSTSINIVKKSTKNRKSILELSPIPKNV